jgi:hypothetical protein
MLNRLRHGNPDGYAPPEAPPWRWRLLLPGISLGFLAAATALYAWARPIYMSVLTALMLRPGATPFFDFEFLLTNAVCWRRGVNVYISNPCDAMNRPMDYSPLWLRMDFLAVDRSWSIWFGLALAMLFCFSLAFLVPRARWRDQLVIGLASISSVSLYALERGNNDIILFVLAVAAGVILARATALRLTGYVLLLAGGLLKFYPAAALIVIARERLKICMGLVVVSAAVIVGFVSLYHGELLVALKNIPRGGYFWDTIGARQLPGGIGTVLQPILVQFVGAGSYSGLAASRSLIYFTALTLMLSLCGFVVWVTRSGEYRGYIAGLPARYATLFQIGAALIVGIFFTGESVSYRAIMLLLVLPALILLDSSKVSRGLRLLSRSTVIIILLVMFRLVPIGVLVNYDLNINNSAIAALIWIGFEVAWWWIVTVLLALLISSLMESQAWREARLLVKSFSRAAGPFAVK